ncbi:MAG: DNA mismatch repair protein MutS [Chloroflexi bacterium]|nr:DNA mismatch repair protein MutS [Chloroflexota bacterium]
MEPVTPIRRQYLRIKSRVGRDYPQAIVLFRLGDFYESFDEDAKLVARELEITLTSREMGKGQRVPMAGIPYHALDNYLGKLIHRGYKVAIVEQLSDPKASVGLVERDVVRVVTPGTVVEPHLLDSKANNNLVAVLAGAQPVSPGGSRRPPANGEAGLAVADITTGEFAVAQLPLDALAAELQRLAPAEVLLPRGHDISAGTGVAVTEVDGGWFEPEAARRALLEHLEVASLEGCGCEGLPLAIGAAGALVRYLEQTQREALARLPRLATYSTSEFMVLDAATRRNLELFEAGRYGAGGHSLLSVLDLTLTAMGGRLLRRWLGQPLLKLEPLNRRLDAVGAFFASAIRRGRARELLKGMPDLERLTNRVRASPAGPRELLSLRRGLERLPELRACVEEAGGAVTWLAAALSPAPDVVSLIAQALADDPSSAPGDGNVIRAGHSAELDGLRDLASNARRYLAELERRERERTGIKGLKVGYNQVFGYYLEVSTANLGLVPPDYIRKQTLSNAERFYTPELKEYEGRVLHAQEDLQRLETQLFRELCQEVGRHADLLLATAGAVAQADVFAALAEAASRYGYVRPALDEGGSIEVAAGRHPVVERALDEPFVPNDCRLDSRDAQVVVLTGPNMAGKSTYLRQVALIVLLAQIGSFVPAGSARLGLVDRIFTRVGAQDDLAAGQSTFMVEMLETAYILNHATPRSLLILDEIGRGTSTYDGLAIARAVIEFIHNHPRLGAKTLFATHYQELTELARVLPRVRNSNVAVTEEGGRVVFLRKIIPGGADKSYGIHVAQLAGLPRPVIRRAQEALAELEGAAARDGQAAQRASARGRRAAPPAAQLPLLAEPSPVEQALAQLDLDGLTPLEALTVLYELKGKLK